LTSRRPRPSPRRSYLQITRLLPFFHRDPRSIAIHPEPPRPEDGDPYSKYGCPPVSHRSHTPDSSSKWIVTLFLVSPSQAKNPTHFKASQLGPRRHSPHRPHSCSPGDQLTAPTSDKSPPFLSGSGYPNLPPCPLFCQLPATILSRPSSVRMSVGITALLCSSFAIVDNDHFPLPAPLPPDGVWSFCPSITLAA